MPTQPVQILPAFQWRAGAPNSKETGPEGITRAAPEETAVGISYDSEPYAVLMATPADVADLALGFTVSERIAQADQVLDIRVSEHDEGLVADVLLTKAGAVSARDRRRRNMEGRSSCGLCGVQSPEDALRALPVLADGPSVTRQAIQSALASLDDLQVLGAATRATHAAAWAAADGRILIIGFASGTVPQIPANILLVKNVTVIGYYWGAYRRLDPAGLRRTYSQLLEWFEAGKIKPHVSRVLPLEEAAKAIGLLKSRSATGKVVLEV